MTAGYARGGYVPGPGEVGGVDSRGAHNSGGATSGRGSISGDFEPRFSSPPATIFGYPVIESPLLPIGQILVLDRPFGRHVTVRRLEHLRWQLDVWMPLLGALRYNLRAHLAGVVADTERRLFGDDAP